MASWGQAAAAKFSEIHELYKVEGTCSKGLKYTPSKQHMLLETNEGKCRAIGSPGRAYLKVEVARLRNLILFMTISIWVHVFNMQMFV